MDVTFHWEKTDAEGLARAIWKVRHLLQSACAIKWGKARVTECDVYVAHSTVDFLRTAAAWTDAAQSPDDPKMPMRLRVTRTSDLVADFKMFKLHDDRIIQESVVRVVSTHAIGDGLHKTMYGNLIIVPPNA